MLHLNLIKPLEQNSSLQERQRPERWVNITTKMQSAKSSLWDIQQDSWQWQQQFIFPHMVRCKKVETASMGYSLEGNE